MEQQKSNLTVKQNLNHGRLEASVETAQRDGRRLGPRCITTRGRQ